MGVRISVTGHEVPKCYWFDGCGFAGDGLAGAGVGVGVGAGVGVGVGAGVGVGVGAGVGAGVGGVGFAVNLIVIYTPL